MVSSNIRKDVVNDILKQFAVILQSYKPTLRELEVIQSKIDSMVAKNQATGMEQETGQHVEAAKHSPKNEKWYKIPVE